MGSLNKTLLVLSGGKEAVEGIKVAKEMGLKVVVCDGDKSAPGRNLADEFLLGNIYDPEEVKKALLNYTYKNRIDGVITIASDAVRSVASVAESLNLPGINKETAYISTEKLRMKECFQKHMIPMPRFTSVNALPELRDKIGCFEQSILKPVDSRGARGVIRIGKHSDLQWAFEHSMQFSLSKRLILEEWLSGPQISTESLVMNGKSYLCGVADRNYSKLKETFPYVVEDGGETPSKYSPEIDEKLINILDKVSKTIGLENGILKGDIVLKNGNPYVIEIATRLSGGFFSTITIPLVYKINLVKMAILLSLGIRINPPKELQNHCFQANRFLFIEPGVVNKVSAPDPDTLPDFVKYFEVNVQEGDRLEKIADHTMRRGSIMVVGSTREQAIARVEKILESIEIEMAYQ